MEKRMRIKHFVLFVSTFVAMLAMSSCENYDTGIVDNPAKEKVVITASTVSENGQTRTTFTDGGKGQGVKQVWDIGDKFDLYDYTGKYAATLVLESGAGQSTAQFVKEGNGPLTDGKYTAVYPSTKALTLAHRARVINAKKQIGNGSLTHIDGKKGETGHCYMKKEEYEYSSTNKKPLAFEMEHVMLTVKMAKPIGYNAATHGAPVSLTFFNGDKSTTLTLEGIPNCNETITAYMIIEPIVGNGARKLRFDLLCEHGDLFQNVIDSEKSYLEGKRYTSDLTTDARKLALKKNYTLETLNEIPADEYTWVITSNINADTELTRLKEKLGEVVGGKIELILPNATSIGLNAFSGCLTLSSVSLPIATEIKDSAFDECESLSSVNLPAIVKIGTQAFNKCALTSINLPAATEVGDLAFNECESLSSINLPAGLVIGTQAFWLCKALSSVSLPAATLIETYAFGGCFSLSSITLPSATNIGVYSFYYCQTLSSASFPAVTVIGERAFNECPELTTLEIGTLNPNALTTVGAFPLAGSPINQMNLIISEAESKSPGTSLADRKWRNYGAFKSITVKP